LHAFDGQRGSPEHTFKHWRQAFDWTQNEPAAEVVRDRLDEPQLAVAVDGAAAQAERARLEQPGSPRLLGAERGVALKT
jgi:hypothetical protein